ncbi:MAG: BamA/TamA family outer membrane protein [Proteobacteria bacterium]|nr:BamA/TamA family outer membrane protein [Pseudomonadota bacterium]
MGVGLILLALLPTLALAQSPAETFGGVEIADVRLLAPEGGLPDESLDALLRAQAGDALSVFAVRTDLATLMRVGEFSAAEAEAEPWFTQDANGDLRQAVMLTYKVWPAPRVASVNLSGVEALKARDVRSALGLDQGDAFYEELDAPTTSARMRRYYANQGYPRARIDVLAAPTDDGVVVDVLVQEGAPQNLSRLSFAGELPVPDKVLRRWARRDGLRDGKPIAAGAITAAQRRIRTRLARFSAFRPERTGWVQARVTPAWVEEGDDLGVTYSIEPGRRLDLEVSGIPWRPKAKVRQALGINERVRLTRGFMDVAPDKVAYSLAEHGFYEASADVALIPGDEVQTLKVDVTRGRRHVLRGDLPWGKRGIAFTGNEDSDHTALRTVLEQASPEVLRLGRITDEELDKGIHAAEKYYESRGHLDAELELTSFEVRPRRFPRSVIDAIARAIPGAAERVLVDIEIEVREGDLTTLSALTVEGAAEDAQLDFVQAEVAELEGAPYSPQALEVLARRIVSAHRDAGYLEADARVVSRLYDASSYNATLEVTSGDQILLRSVVTRGARRTRNGFLRREVDQQVGTAVTSESLDDLRRQLVDLGIFRTVDLALLGDEPGRDLLITVEERPIHSWEVGGGGSTDQGIRAFGRYTRHNLWGRAHRLDVFGAVGVEYASDSLSDWRPDFRTEPEWRAGLTYTAPRFPLRSQRVVIDLLLREQRFERTYEMGQFGVAAGLITALPSKTQIRLGARLEGRRLEEADVGALLPGEVWTEHLRPGDGPLTRWRVQDTLEAIALQDWRDDPLSPTRGAVVRLLGEIAPGGVGISGSSVSFMKTEARVTGWIPLRGATLRITAEGGHAFMLADGLLPLEDRYRLGGTGSLRGFRRDAVGPRRQVGQVDVDWPSGLEPMLAQATRDHPTRWVPVGGDTVALGIFELVLPLPVLGMSSWDGYALRLFTDVGNVWLVRGRDLAHSESDAVRSIFSAPVRASVGAGISIETPIGPLGIDVATNLQSLSASGATQVLLREDWEEPPVRIHLSLGALQ